MKRIFISLFSVLCLTSTADAQVRIAPFLGYGEQLGLWGLGAYAEIVANEKLSFSAVFTQYFPEKLDNLPDRTVWELNGNLNYYIVRGEVGYLYGLAGVNFTNIRTHTRTAVVDEVDADGNLGVNLGLGTMVRLNDLLLPFIEAKYTVGEYTQLGVIFGVKFQLGEGTVADNY